MKIKKLKSWKNFRCIECGRGIFNTPAYKVWPNLAVGQQKRWLLCEDCFKKMFKD